MTARVWLPSHTPRRVAAAALALLAVIAVEPAQAAGAGAWCSLGLLGGSTLTDSRLANYQWDTRPRMAWGAQALAGTGRYALGVRAWRSQTVQALALPSGPVSPVVSEATDELLGRVRVATIAGARLSVTAGAGRLQIAYRPARVVVASGPGGDVIADLAPVSQWTASAGLVAERALFGQLQGGLSLDRQAFALDTAHRSGAAIVNARESFSDWSTRIELGWRFPLTVKGTSR